MLSRSANVKYFPLVLSLILIIPITALPINLSSHLLIISKAWSASYYVDATNGKDINNGLSPSAAWKTIAKINASRFNPGDQILFKRGDSWYEPIIPNSSGSAGMPIILDAYGQGNLPIIGVGTERAIDINDKSYLTIENLDLRARDRCISIGAWNSGTKYGITIRNNTMTSSAHGVYINCTSGAYDTISITENTITPGKTGLWQIGINFVAGVSNFIIRNNIISPAGEDGIMIHKCYDGIISGNTLGGNVENSIDVKNSHDIVIFGNHCADDGEANIVVHDADTAPNDLTYNITVEKNKCFRGGQGDRAGQGYRIYAGIFFLYANNCIIRYNWVEEAFGTGILILDLESKVNNNKVYGNIIFTCGTGTGAISQGGIQIGDCVGTKVYNNTIYNQQGTGGHGIYVLGGPHTIGIEIKNNIIHTTGGDLIRVLSSAQKNYVSDYNCFYPDGRKFYWGNAYANSFSDWKTKSRMDLHSLATDPQFNSTLKGDFALKITSPCRDQGTNVGLTKDFNGLPIPQGKGADMGAIESSSSNISPPTNLRME